MAYKPTWDFPNPSTRNGQIVHVPKGPKSLPACGWKSVRAGSYMMWTNYEPNCPRCAGEPPKLNSSHFTSTFNPNNDRRKPEDK